MRHGQNLSCRALGVVQPKKTLVMISASFSVVLTRCSEIGSCTRNRKHVSAWTRRCPSFAEEPLLTAMRSASRAPLTRSIVLAARPHSIDSDSVELVLGGPCRRLAHSIKKELPLDPRQLDFCSSETLRAERRIAESAEPQLLPIVIRTFHDERPFSSVCNETENVSDFFSSPRAPACDKFGKSCNVTGTTNFH